MPHKHNFGAGPCILPQEVFEQAAQAVLSWGDTGLSILEISHRTPEFESVVAESVQLIKELMQVPEGYEVIFVQGGASLQFGMLPMNLLNEEESAAYLDTGVWANKALKEAKLFGPVTVVADSSDKKHTYLQKDLQLPVNTTYLHITTNNTVEGTQWHQYPQTNVPLIGDMSSDIFCRPTEFKKFDLIYGDKNIYSTAIDLYLWDNILKSTAFLKKETTSYAYEPKSILTKENKTYGYGWRLVFPENQEKIIYHNGWWHGNNTALIRLIEKNAVIIILGNRYNDYIYSHKRFVEILRNMN